MNAGPIDPASFRDPAGRVFSQGGRVFRTVEPHAWSNFDAVRSSGILRDLIAAGRVIDTVEVERAALPAELAEGVAGAAPRFLEHERIPFVSYPYEWPFKLLKKAALHHLDLHLELLDAGFTLTDAAAYNVQFRGIHPVFIDVLSIRRYREGEYWPGYRQFCEQFLNPLLLGAELGVPHQPWFRGSLEGIRIEDIARAMPARTRLRWQAWLHVFVHAKVAALAPSHRGGGAAPGAFRQMPASTLAWMLRSMRAWIGGMAGRGHEATRWKEYERRHSYLDRGLEAKQAFVAEYVRRERPATLLDVGCNSGAYAELALASGAARVVGLDQDLGALDAAIGRAEAQRLDFLPLYMDAANPSPDQGWAQRERAGLQHRVDAQGLLALAILHHLVIGQNVPMDAAVGWLVGLAPTGVIEFVPKTDPMVQGMLMQREDIFGAYGIESFRGAVARHAAIVAEAQVPGTDRILVEYVRSKEPRS